MSWWWLLGLPPALLLADRLLLRVERQGWIFYRRRKPSGCGGAALGPLLEVFQPSRTVLVQEQRRQQSRRVEQGTADPHLPGRPDVGCSRAAGSAPVVVVHVGAPHGGVAGTVGATERSPGQPVGRSHDRRHVPAAAPWSEWQRQAPRGGHRRR
jgi:hypothetical protein